MTTDALVQIIQSYGLLLLFPLAMIEGPIITVIGGWLARAGLLPLGWVYVTAVVADLVGDMILYYLGRSGTRFLPARWLERLGIGPQRLAKLSAHFDQHGGRTIVLTKLTHAFGIAVLPAAGAARMNVPSFLLFNLLATLPKTLFFLAVGYLLGQAHARIGNWIWWGSALVLLAGAGYLVYRWRHRKAHSA